MVLGLMLRPPVVNRITAASVGPMPEVLTCAGLFQLMSSTWVLLKPEQVMPPPPLPARPATQPFYPGLDDWGYGRSIGWRFTRGGFDRLGAADVWARVRLPLVAGVALTGQDRALILADSANGLSLSLPLTQWFSIPPTMTATLLRPPAEEWVHLACRTYLADDGVGLARADLSDLDGLIGEVAQPLLVQKREPDNGVS